MVAGRMVRKARPHRGDRTAVPGEAASQEVLGMAWEAARHCGRQQRQVLHGETEMRATRPARTMGKRLMLRADTGHYQGPHSARPGSGSCSDR